MKPIFIIALAMTLLTSNLLFAQEGITTLSGKIAPLTIDVGYDKTINLIFPYSIKSVDRGSREVLVQKAKGVENLLQVKAALHDFSETNLTVVTGEGSLYSFLLRYNNAPRDLNLNIAEMAFPSEQVVLLSGGRSTEAELFEIAKRIQMKKRTMDGPKDLRHDVSMKIEGIFTHGDDLYFQLKLANGTFIAYDVDQFRLYFKDRKRTKRTATQEVEVEPVYIEGNCARINGKSEQTVVIVLKKFTIPDKKNFVIQIMENNGGRHLRINIKNKHLIRTQPI